MTRAVQLRRVKQLRWNVGFEVIPDQNDAEPVKQKIRNDQGKQRIFDFQHIAVNEIL